MHTLHNSMALFLIYFPRATPSTTPSDPDTSPEPEPPSYRSALLVVLLCIFYAVALGIASTYTILVAPPSVAWRVADGLGITATALAAIQYFPQIYTTYRLQSLGSLSIPMMCVQTPGGLLWAASLAARLGWEGWSAWILYVFISTLQGVVLGMGLWFKWKKRGQVSEEEEEEGDGDHESAVREDADGRDGEEERGREGRRGRDEQTPLLQSEN